MSAFNPFHGIVETIKYPHSRAHRTKFWGKIKDTFGVFFGALMPDFRNNVPDPLNKIHAGIFDYLTIGIHFTISELLLSLAKNSQTPLLAYPLQMFAVLFNVPRALFAGIMTLICLPFIGIAHLISVAKSGIAKEEILSYSLHTPVSEDTLEQIIPEGSSSLRHTLQKKNIELEDLEYANIEIDSADADVIHLTLTNGVKPITSCSLNLKNAQDFTFFKNIRMLNISGVQSLIEETESLSLLNS